MRIKIETNIIEKTKPKKTNYTHETYSMILNNIEPNEASRLHEKKKFFRLLTFTNIFIDKKSNKAHFYIAGKDSLIQDFIRRVSFNQLIRIDDMVLNITNILKLPELKKKDKYKFKTKLVVNIAKDRKTTLADDFDYIKKRLSEIVIAKSKELGIDNKNSIQFKIINSKHNVEKYKDGHINSWKCKLEVTGDYDLVNTLYNVGAGNNTASGHGFVWEV